MVTWLGSRDCLKIRRFVFVFLFLTLLLNLFSQQVWAQYSVCTVHKVAGTGMPGESLDGEAAASAKLIDPLDVTVAPDGALVFLDNNMVRVIGTDGVLETIAGKGNLKPQEDIPVLDSQQVGFSADSKLSSVAVSSGGDIYFLERILGKDNYPVYLYKISQGNEFSSIAFSLADDDISEYTSVLSDPNTVLDGRVLTDIKINYISDIAIGPSNQLYLSAGRKSQYTWMTGADNRIISIDPDTLKVKVVAGLYGNFEGGFSGDGDVATKAMLDGPYIISFDGAGNLLFVDYFNFRLRKVTLDGIIQTVAGSGAKKYSEVENGEPAIVMGFSESYPVSDVVGDTNGNIYLNASGRIWKVTPNGRAYRIAGGGGVSAIASDGFKATEVTKFSDRAKLAIDASNNIYIADTDNSYMIHKLTCSDVSGNGPVIATDTSGVSVTGASGGANANPSTGSGSQGNGAAGGGNSNSGTKSNMGDSDYKKGSLQDIFGCNLNVHSRSSHRHQDYFIFILIFVLSLAGLRGVHKKLIL